MDIRILSAVVLSLALGAVAWGQDPNSAAPAQQNPGGPGGGRGGFGQRGGYGGMGAGRGFTGTVTEVASDHYSVKTESGETYTVRFSASTRMLKQPAGMGGGQGRGGGQGADAGQGAGGGQGRGGYGGMGRGGNPPQPIKASDIKVGDAIGAMGEVDANAKSVVATTIVQLDPERARLMREVQANYGKTWLMGKVTAIDGTQVTLLGSVDNAAHSFVADENTTFRKRRDPVTLADIQVGDVLRAEGALKDGSFTATSVMVVGMPPGGTPSVPRNGPPPQ